MSQLFKEKSLESLEVLKAKASVMNEILQGRYDKVMLLSSYQYDLLHTRYNLLLDYISNLEQSINANLWGSDDYIGFLMWENEEQLGHALY